MSDGAGNFPAWKEHVRRAWQAIGLEEFCANIGINYQSAFEDCLNSTSANANPYSQYRWEILRNSTIPSGVLHLVPIMVATRPALWEEWFLQADQIHHHVLRNHPYLRATDYWIGDETDTDHPKEVLGIRWHHFNDADLRPTEFR